MKKSELENILKIISETLKEPVSKISIKSKSCDFVKWDSLSQVTMMIKLEKFFKKKINTSRISELDSVKKIVDYFEKSNK